MNHPPEKPPSMPLSMAEPMEAEMPKTRKRLIVSGNVQEAGYRVLVKSIAKSMGVAGFARNLPDETVEIVCEAGSKTLERFLKAIDRKGDPASPTDINVVSMVETPAPAGGEFNVFKIEYDGRLSPEERENAREAREERMIVGASFLREDIKQVGQKVDGVGKAVDGVGQKVDSMHSDMNKRFDHMADRYDMIATSLKEAIVHMDRNAEKTDKAIEKSRKETILAVRQSQKETAKILANNHKDTTTELAKARKDFAASNRELAKAVNFMIRRLSDRPARKSSRKARK